MRPILSICIPTYNRAQYLKQALDALIVNKAFNEEVEIVISDNCSNDDTENLGRSYSEKYANIKYFRNSENIKDSNFCLALDRASGYYVKLMNDNHIITDNGLQYLIDRIKNHFNDRTAIFFTGIFFDCPLSDSCYCKSFEDFVVHLSYFVTAIHCFGAWKEDWDKVVDRKKYTQLKLNQDDWAYQIMVLRKECVLYSGTVMNPITIDNKYRSGYNWFQVHVANYYKILQPYINKGLMSNSAIAKEKKINLNGMKGIIAMSFLPRKISKWQFDYSGKEKILWDHFKNVPYFYCVLLTTPLRMLKYLIKSFS